MAGNPTFCSFTSILTVLLTFFINKPNSLRDLFFFSWYCSFLRLQFLSLVCYVNSEGRIPKSVIFWWIAGFADDAAVNPNGVKMPENQLKKKAMSAEERKQN